jgi:hypothetical protein
LRPAADPRGRLALSPGHGRCRAHHRASARAAGRKKPVGSKALWPDRPAALRRGSACWQICCRRGGLARRALTGEGRRASRRRRAERRSVRLHYSTPVPCWLDYAKLNGRKGWKRSGGEERGGEGRGGEGKGWDEAGRDRERRGWGWGEDRRGWESMWMGVGEGSRWGADGDANERGQDCTRPMRSATRSEPRTCRRSFGGAAPNSGEQAREPDGSEHDSAATNRGK